MIPKVRLTLIVFLFLFASGCATNGANTSEKRAAIQESASETLAKLYKLKPHARQQISSAPGYGVFSNANVNVILASFGSGHGYVKNNTTGKTTYMRMGEVGVGFGAGVKDYRIVMVFDSESAMNNFIDKGWVVGAQADAAAKASDTGAAAGAEATINGMTVYQLTESGLALQATVKGTKFWKDAKLN